ncbi:MAG: DNA/RNA non-specific endonuclease [Enterococcus sp.]|uniref:DNA/RNA non-specific endonuclease n=1 Tax=Enterococcus sp. TaxID=35783 RepID=UPI00264965D7|nr:DNA/RNA non-specific endonuclease [Enterococcus sp.]MDN6004493.1 DNA/RNA non-specific endonuclease [Enterococcus sp.]MDN6216419.1 DNA/RNA non-specific endonuclease [Enterococcus sp.]MDN6559902.1 DNA/RNA non-specific endonuclease [Enterococcus sp.]MDN6616370.1 DNA/RNA non-specific endonuclease [Enterococcus sp.]MDN6650265.1 DNA/RNA non-specific endonuclease [Enterococcus sp.]
MAPDSQSGNSNKEVVISQLSEIPEYDGEHQTIEINHNQPDFSKKDLSLEQRTWTSFSDLDALNRVGVANAMLGKELMPHQERERLFVKPTGWHQKFYNDEPLYNRAHLIAYQFSGENNNLKNLMTGTASLNDPGMNDHEKEIGNYIRKTNHHVRYRVSPYFKGEELVARGIQMEAESIEDDQISFNLFVYNVQEGITIDYQTGYSQKE